MTAKSLSSAVHVGGLPVRNEAETPTLRVVAISDTHGMHASLNVPPGDILVHGGDFTRFGSQTDAIDFNIWLGTLPHLHKFVVFGNHEVNAPWRDQAAEILTNATLLCNSSASLERLKSSHGREIHSDGATSSSQRPLCIWGTDFYWPVVAEEGRCFFEPPYAHIPAGIDLLLTHCPPAVPGVDDGVGCGFLLDHVRRARPQSVVCGHIHQAHAVVEGSGELDGIIFVNASNAGGPGAKQHSRRIGWPAVVLDL